MLDPRYIDYAQHVAKAASDGSPAVVRAAGRLLGLGQSERDVLASRGVPGWVWAALGVSVGVVAGIRIDRKWSRKIPKWLSGG